MREGARGVTALSFKLGERGAREAIAALTPLVPWWARERLAEFLNNKLGVQFTVDFVRRKHSDAQRGYYHMGVGMLAKHLGMSHDECHGAILIEHFGGEDKQFMGRTVTIPLGRSRNLPIDAYGELIETMLRVAAWAGVMIPDPETVA